MFDFLREVNRRPEVFGEYTVLELWNDPHTSEQMLAYHLDENVDAASRNHFFINSSAEWIVSHFELGVGARVADFGCGPGLYAQRLSRSGLNVTGIDFSNNSLRYAREKAAEEGLDIKYVESNYLTYDTDTRFDLIMMIMCDFCALSPDQRAVLLHKFQSMLADEGAVLLDVYSLNMFDGREETAIYEKNLLDGFWPNDEYYGYLNTFKYNDKRVILDKYTIVERFLTRCIYNWFQCFTPTDVEREFADAGLKVVEVWGDVAGKEYESESSEFAVVAKASNMK